MQQSFLYSTSQFGWSPDGIHLLRNGFNFKTIPVDDISNVQIKDGMDRKNWWWVLLVGVVLLSYGLFDVYQILRILLDVNTKEIHYFRFFIPSIPLVLGAYSVFVSLRKAKVLLVLAGERQYYLSLREIEQAGQLPSFMESLQQLRKRIRTF